MSQYRVLLVDDEEELVFTIVERLELRDIDAKCVTRASEAIKLLDNEEFDVVVSDVKMPEMDGIELMKRIKEKNPSTQVIMVTGHTCQDNYKRGRKEGAFDYLAKPIKIEKLIKKIEEAVIASKGAK